MGACQSTCRSLLGIRNPPSADAPLENALFCQTTPQNSKNQHVIKCIKRNRDFQERSLYKGNSAKTSAMNSKRGPMKHRQTGLVYQGEWKGEVPEGVGKVYFEGGQYFSGQIVRGLANGIGMFVMIDGSSYVGNFVQNKAEGEGTYSDRQGKVLFKGTWLNSKPEKGTYYLPQNTTVTFENGNYGVLKKHNEDQYRGYLNKFFLPHGEGIMTFKSGPCKQYNGFWQNGAFNGKGKMVWTDGSSYDGTYAFGQKHGEGTYIYKYKQEEKKLKIYKGGWKNGKQHGKGILYIGHEKIYDVTFENGNLVDNVQRPNIVSERDIEIKVEQKKPGSKRDQDNKSKVTSHVDCQQK